MDLPNLMQGLSTNSSKTIFKTCGAEIDKVHTDFVWGDFDNCVVLMVTQFGRIGSLVVAEKESALSPAVQEVSYDTKYLLGAGDIENQVAAKFLAQNFNLQKPLYLFSSLKDYSAETLKAVTDVCLDVFKT